MQLHSKAVAILIMFLFLMASVVPMINGNISNDDFGPVTSIFYNEHTGMVTLVAVDYPLNKGEGVKATYYKIDGGPQIEYSYPFQLPEGTHSVEYWSEDFDGHEEMHKTVHLTFGNTPPIVEIIKPEAGGIYFLGNKIFNLGSTAICIGNVTVEANANDGEGYGVKAVFFNFSNGDSGYDYNSADGWTYNFNNPHFGELEITLTAIDEKELMSEPDTVTVTVFSLGIL